MRELERRQRIKRGLYSWPSVLVLAFVVAFLAKGAMALVVKERESSREAKELGAKVASLRDREQELTAEIDKLGTRAGIEEEIKSKYNVAGAGEHVAVIVDRPEHEGSTTPEILPWWKHFWDVIIGR